MELLLAYCLAQATPSIAPSVIAPSSIQQPLIATSGGSRAAQITCPPRPRPVAPHTEAQEVAVQHAHVPEHR